MPGCATVTLNNEVNKEGYCQHISIQIIIMPNHLGAND